MSRTKGGWGGPRKPSARRAASSRSSKTSRSSKVSMVSMSKADITEETEYTSAELAKAIATLTSLSADEIQRLFSTKREKLRLARIVVIMSASTSQKEKFAKLVKEASELGPVVVRLLQKMLL